MKNHPLHQKALSLVKTYLSTEAELIECLKQIFLKKLFIEMGYTSMHQYATMGLGLSDDRAYLFTRVAKVCVEVPALQAAIEEKKVSLSHARILLPVINAENSEMLLQQAMELPKRELEKKVAKAFPDRPMRETLKPVSETRSELRVGLSQEMETKLNRVKELVSSKLRKTCSLEEALGQMVDSFLKSHDPLEKAKRNLGPGPKAQRGVRRAIPAAIRHQVWVRDHGQCQGKNPDGSLCGSRQFLEIHHHEPWSVGGDHCLENLELRCWAHHRQVHGVQVTSRAGAREEHRRR